MNEVLQFRSNGKLLISGEYLVLKGAKALALPTTFGQDLSAQPIEKPGISWTANVKGKIWFRADFEFDRLAISAASDLEIAEKLQEILRGAQLLNPEFFKEPIGYDVITNLEFNRNWGLGSSSTLIANVAQWTNCNPYELNKIAFKGSGYDIACARSNSPLIYQLKDELPIVENVEFHPSFSNQLYFVWLNKKQDTQMEIGRFHKQCYFTTQISLIDQITEKLLAAKALSEFQNLMEEHESLISKVIQTPKVKDQLFADFDGTIKSLGAWGGDFILVASAIPDDVVKNYFKQKGFTTVFKYNEIIKTLNN